jgi:hypothetical protein
MLNCYLHAVRDTIGKWAASVNDYNLENNKGNFQDNRPALGPNDTYVAGQTLAVGEFMLSTATVCSL